jgi:hypothetical protein
MKGTILLERTGLGRVSTATKGNAFSVIERIGLHEPAITLRGR